MGKNYDQRVPNTHVLIGECASLISSGLSELQAHRSHTLSERYF